MPPLNLLQIVGLHCLDIHEYKVLGEIQDNIDIDIMGSFVFDVLCFDLGDILFDFDGL